VSFSSYPKDKLDERMVREDVEVGWRCSPVLSLATLWRVSFVVAIMD
jgi:hypothetical protein